MKTATTVAVFLTIIRDGGVLNNALKCNALKKRKEDDKKEHGEAGRKITGEG